MLKKLTIILAFVPILLWGQNKTVTGTVTGAGDGMPLPGVTVLVKGTNQGTSTDFDGNYSIKNVKEGTVLQFSYVGFTTKEVKVKGGGNSLSINVLLKESAEALEEVVVTALGIKREKKSLGYALQEVKGDALNQAREMNLSNAFTGKVAGLQVVRSSNGPAGSSKIVLRGNNSLTGDNQPLIVVDGIPMDNFNGTSNPDIDNPGNDMGSGLGDLNPNDIESTSVLKGPAAAALYGSRAGNGVILITTKSGKANEGLGITYSSSVGFEDIFMKPDLQTSFAQGGNGTFDVASGSSWGPKIEGQTVTDWKGRKVKLQAYDNLKNFMKTGTNIQHSLSFQQKVSKGTSVYSSVTHVDNQSSIPGANLKRTNFITRAISKYGKDNKWSTDFKVQYINTKVHNRPLNGLTQNNSFGTLVGMPVTVNILDMAAATNEEGKHFWYNPASGLNPYWMSKYALNDDSRDRFLLNGSIKYNFTDWLNLELRAGSDLYTTNTESKMYAGPVRTNGSYSLGKNTFNETNASFLFNLVKDNVIDKIGVAATFGGNLMTRKHSNLSSSVGELEFPDIFSLNNVKGGRSVSNDYSVHKINSLYGTLQLNYDGYLYLDLTGRNDWSSALSKANRSFFYPSVSTSLVFSELIKKITGENSSWLDYGKVRASYATVGNDMGPYQLYNYYTIGYDSSNNTSTSSTNSTFFDENVKNELIKSIEFGLEMKMFEGRLGLDVSLYKTNATNQLLNIPINSLSGYSSRMMNAGNIENKGFEIMLNARPIQTKSFAWDVSVNWSKNINTIVDILESEGVTQYGLKTFEDFQILAVAGEKYGSIYGSTFKRVDDASSPHHGKVIVDGEGLPLKNGDVSYLGNQQPDAMIGLTNSISYKNFTFSMLIDGKIGGKIFSGTNWALKGAGNAATTVKDGKREDFVYDGVVADENGGYTENTKEIKVQDYWTRVTGQGRLGIIEDNIYDATNVRIRNIQLTYQLPKQVVSFMGAQSAKLGFSMNNVYMIKSYLNGVDPESVYATGTNATGFELLSPPTTRSYFFNASVSF